MTDPVVARLRRAPPLLFCKKCLKRAGSGENIRREAKHALKRRRTEAIKPARLVATGCFGICPKRAVVFASGPSLGKGEYVLVSDQHDVESAFDLLGLPGRE